MEDLSVIIEELLNDFYKRRIEKISKLELKNTLARKNPYLYKAVGVEKASDIVSEILTAYMSSSDEGIFGDAFFEPLAERIGKGHVAETEGVDVIVEDEHVYKAFAVKSGTNVFNADSRKKQADNFNSLRKRVAKRKKFFDAIVGYGYGRKETAINKQGFREVAGQAFWEELTGDSEFYLKIISVMGDRPQQHLVEYRKAFDAAVNRFTKEFINDFCNEDGAINWEKIVKFNSGRACKQLIVTPISKTMDIHEELQLSVKAFMFDEEEVDMTQSPEVDYLIKSGEEFINVDEYGIIQVKENAIGGTIAKIIIFCLGKSRTVTIKVKKAKRNLFDS
ncbi:PmeII family type II restriction endonuclease [Priestia megaterium]|uniref:PmeII family type II restriction endonuclease n=1 Tax=Priestia megaterium TaxID=1404 RepID=UPI0022203E72|nr:PmeII family type II restriction endonuclease [Priestia megaterium]UYV50704.1 PmeII family type II restriction endonuclease [Priestia megaterium]